jgi:hypothetical protein
MPPWLGGERSEPALLAGSARTAGQSEDRAPGCCLGPRSRAGLRVSDVLSKVALTGPKAVDNIGISRDRCGMVRGTTR